MASFNDQVIEKFRATDGDVGGHWAGKTLLLLHHVGRRSGQEYVTPLVAAPDGDAYIVCGSLGGAPGGDAYIVGGSLGGAPEEPQWVATLEAADGTAKVELGAATLEAPYEV